MKKVLEITTVGITARAFLIPLFQELQDQGFAVTYASTPDFDALETSKAAGVPFFPVSISRSISPRDIISFWKLYRFIKSEKFDIVHTHTAKAGFVGRMAARMAGVPVILHTAHGLTVHPGLSKFKKKLYLFLERFAARRTKKFICVTKLVEDSLVEQGITEREKCVVIPNFAGPSYDPENIDSKRRGALQNRLNLPPDSFLLMCASRLVDDKGLEESVSALHDLPGNVFLALAGDGPNKEKLQKLAALLQVEKRVRFLGWVDTFDMPALLSLCDVFISGTKREGFGVGIIEAQAMGLPVITSRIRPITDLLDPESALFIDTSTKESTREGILQCALALYKDEQKRRALSEKALENAKKYSIENYRANIRSFIQRELS
ncbi:glycosyltransferase [bacterium]|nr:glycosyltransferase [bacterium]